MKKESIKCNLCAFANYDLIYRTKPRPEGLSEIRYLITEADIEKPERIYRCNVCGLIFAEQEKDPRYYLKKYGEMVDEEYLNEERGRRKSARKILKRIKKYKKTGNMLDIGCSCGFLLDEARKDGWQPFGVEISEWASKHAKEKFNLNVKTGSPADAAFPERFFDVIMMIDVLEHVSDPKQTLIEARRILKDDGILCLSTPDISSVMSKILKAKWWGINKFHLFYFSKRTLEKILDACGFRVKRYNPHVRAFSLKYWVKRFKAYNLFLYKILNSISNIDNFGNSLIEINFRDQIEVLAVKARKLDYLASSAASKKEETPKKHMKVFVVLPAYNAEKTLERTVRDIPKDIVDKVILVDDRSKDRTVDVAKNLGLEVFQHDKNKGYGANQKTCYRKAIEEGADIVVMVHPDYQYDPTIIPKLIEPIQKGEADAVFGSRMMKGGALEGGMPLWKHNVNILLTAFENVILGTYLTEYHSGFRAYSSNLLRTVNFELNSDKFVFDTEIIVQALIHHFKIEEVPIQTRYFDEASKIKFLPSVLYGICIIWTMIKYILHTRNIIKFKQFK